MSVKKIIAASALALTFNAIAASGDQTLSVGFIQMDMKGYKSQSGTADALASKAYTNMSSVIGAPVKVSSDGYNKPQGMFIRYRYEFDDMWGLMGSVAYATHDGATSGEGKRVNADETFNKFDGRARVTGDYVSALIGPSLRLNDYISFYALAGASFQHISVENDDETFINSVRTEKNSSSSSRNNTGFAYSFGAQVNVWQGLVIDAAYEGGTGSGDWKANGFTVGVGYKF
ncbi:MULTISPECIES: Ail/Lom family outer membrane beta-barrel protein [unclassified Erwinia]|uniref:Ail/Lom family outer membrane beta-barrel protein n=1 Tax=unclassified Erwinia TaxID=2622719 RepID=UPI000C1A8417|nr:MULTISPECIES: Ail/Lom family outer membrane beta-barrel protein [unclassified Erwinia]PIJ49206.1 hypothetical protein BV501_13850 [Erwinia sp. OAMSP11]PIJ79887.1 hypothetical protein BLD47_12500 [Erwinia sp. OLCASP19]PIJ81055.1 hypothetical protein BLD46_13310 [Erwinia sp. OLMTSP26]PIJ93111.1 hypothetical protein BL249_05155 [Erwinia sp. OLFS4]